MPQEIKQLLGAIDLDSPPEGVGRGFIRSGRNIEWFGSQPNMRPQNIVGNTLLANANLPGTGINLTLGRLYDQVKQRLFFWNYNSGGDHGIYIFYTLTGTFVRLVQSGVMTDGDILGFTSTGRIHSINIIYGDGTDGDLLVFVDSLRRPIKINIDRFLASQTFTPSWTGGTYSIFKSAYMDVIKAPPLIPYCVYENDTTVTNNNMINSLFNVTCSFIYDDFEQSVLGSAAKQVLPSDPFDPQNNTDKTRNARLAIYVPTGDQNVKKIRIWGKQTKDGITTDWFIIDTLIKADLGIGDNTVYRYLFFNNGNYITIDPTYSILDYDVVPIGANTQSLLNGNVLSYGGITEGYDYKNVNLTIATSNQNPPAWSLNGTLFFAATNGQFTGSQPQLTVYLTGVGVNDGFGNATTLEKPPVMIAVRAKSNGSDVSFLYSNFTNSASIPFLMNALLAAANTAGWTTVSTATNSFTIYYPTGTVVLQSSYLNGVATSHSPYASAIPSHFPEAAYSYGIIELDEDGRNAGVLNTVTGNIKTQLFSDGQIPVITISLAGYTPSPWAVGYEIVRTDNLTYLKYLDWVSAGAYQGTGAGTSTVFGYFDVSNISAYNVAQSATEGVISYSFSPGDRIRVIGRYDSAGAFTSINLDYAVIGSPTLIVASGVVKTGQFIQIYYPTADIGPNFQFPNTINDTNFQNYKILIYSYKAYLPSNQNVFFRIGQQYGIGNPGTNTAYYMGNTADNQIILSDGDVFYRQRSVPIISTYLINTGGFDQTSPYGTLWVNPGGGAIPIVDNGIWKIVGGVQKVAGLLGTQYPTYSENDFTIFNETTSQTLAVRLRGTQPVTDKKDPNGQFSMYVKVVLPGNVVQLTQILPLQTGLQPGVSNNFVFDVTIQLTPLGKLWIINHAVNEMLIGGFVITLDVIRALTINIFDYSQSDIYALRTNSDNKPNVVTTTAKQTYYSTLFRWGQAYQLGTELNNSNRFYPLDFDEFDKSYGSIIRLYVWQRELRIFQERRTGHVGVYAKFIKDNGGNTSLVTTDDIISKNNIEYFDGNFGIGNQPSALISSGYQNYFPDPIRGCWLRVSLDGVKNISEEFMVQAFAGPNLPNYLLNYTYQFGGRSVMVGTYNFKKDKDGEVLFALQGGTTGSSTIPGLVVPFNERKNSFTASAYDINCDDIICCENQLYSFSNGNLWIHNNTTTYCNFFGVQYQPTIEFIFNEQMPIKKSFFVLSYQANQFWEALNFGHVQTSLINPDTGLPQTSQLVDEDFEILEGLYSAAYLFDSNSNANPTLGLNEGDRLKGFYIRVLLTYRGSNFAYIYMPTNHWEISAKTP